MKTNISNPLVSYGLIAVGVAVSLLILFEKEVADCVKELATCL